MCAKKKKNIWVFSKGKNITKLFLCVYIDSVTEKAQHLEYKPQKSGDLPCYGTKKTWSLTMVETSIKNCYIHLYLDVKKKYFGIIFNSMNKKINFSNKKFYKLLDDQIMEFFYKNQFIFGIQCHFTELEIELIDFEWGVNLLET